MRACPAKSGVRSACCTSGPATRGHFQAASHARFARRSDSARLAAQPRFVSGAYIHPPESGPGNHRQPPAESHTVVGHAIPSDVRADFTEKNKAGCLIEPFGGVRNLRFMSSSEEEKLFARDWSEFIKRYGKGAERVAMSRVGFSSDKSLALVHILYSSSGELATKPPMALLLL